MITLSKDIYFKPLKDIEINRDKNQGQQSIKET